MAAIDTRSVQSLIQPAGFVEEFFHSTPDRFAQSLEAKVLRGLFLRRAAFISLWHTGRGSGDEAEQAENRAEEYAGAPERGFQPASKARKSYERTAAHEKAGHGERQTALHTAQKERERRQEAEHGHQRPQDEQMGHPRESGDERQESRAHAQQGQHHEEHIGDG